MKDISFMRLVKSFFKEASMFLYAAYAPFAFCSFTLLIVTGVLIGSLRIMKTDEAVDFLRHERRNLFK